MSHDLLVDDVGEWLIKEALGWPDIVTLFEQLCVRLNAVGLRVDRGRVTWPTLHPLFRAETVLWKPGSPAELTGFVHQDRETEDWLQSPIKWMLDNDVDMLRRRLVGPEARFDFPLMEDLRDQGYTDFLSLKTYLRGGPVRVDDAGPRYGVYVTWTTRAPEGFSDADVIALNAIQPRFAVACKTAILPRITANIANTYLGPTAAEQVLAGQIQLGSGQQIKALVWFSDLRGSTHFAETLKETDYLELLNAYFHTVAEAAVEVGGEILAFIGDAILVIFPVDGDGDLGRVTRAATRGAEVALTRAQTVNAERVAEGKTPFTFGIAMNVGKVMFGNIGIAQRLTFSVIGNTVNEVERIEKLTKDLGEHLLVTQTVAKREPELWRSVGSHRLAGVDVDIELFAPVDPALSPLGDTTLVPMADPSPMELDRTPALGNA